MRLIKIKFKWIVVDNWRLCTKYDNIDEIECVKERQRQRQRNREQTWRPWQSEEPSFHEATTFWPDFHPREATGVGAFVLEWLWPLGSCLWFSVAAAQSASTSGLSTFSLLHGMAINITNNAGLRDHKFQFQRLRVDTLNRHLASSLQSTLESELERKIIDIYFRTWTGTWTENIVDFISLSGPQWRSEEEEFGSGMKRRTRRIMATDEEQSFTMKLSYNSKPKWRVMRTARKGWV
jgi:hypothetical protein